MSIELRSPGVYVQELPSGTPSIAPANTAHAAFIDFFGRGPIGRPQMLTSAGDFNRIFGGLDPRSESSYQILQYFLNGGAAAYGVRVAPADAATASVVLGGEITDSGGPAPQSRLQVSATSPGVWGNRLEVAAVQPTQFDESNPTVTLIVQEIDGLGHTLQIETFTALSFDPSSPNYCVAIVNAESELISLTDFGADCAFPALAPPPSPGVETVWQALQGGLDGVWDSSSDEFANALIAELTAGTDSLAKIEPNRFNTLCIPATVLLEDSAAVKVMLAAQQSCESQRAFYLVDIPDSTHIPDPQKMIDWLAANRTSLSDASAAVYYPRLTVPDPLNSNKPREVGNSGTIAGLYAANDLNHGVWKAPAGTQGRLAGVELVYQVTDAEGGLLNSSAINPIRSFPVYGIVCWGSRTLLGADDAESDWKYIPVRRLTLFIENSLYAGLAWVVCEPNAQPLWSSIALTVNAFLTDLYRQGAFIGTTPSEAFFVRCDATTNTQNNIDQGIVNVVVGFAPLKPAEFVIIQIQLLAGCAA